MGDRGRTTWTRAALLAIAAVAASLVTATPAPVEAATIVVDDPGDAVIPDFNDGVVTLREAVFLAQPGDTIRFDPSLFADTISLDQTITIDKNLTIVGLGNTALTVDSAVGAPLLVDLDASLTISDLRLSGVSTGIDATNSGDVQVDRVVIEADFAGIDFDSPGADLRLNGTFVDGHAQQGIRVGRADAVVLVDSTARNNGSEGLKWVGATSSIGSLRLENSDLSDNGASGLEASVVVGDVVVIDSFLEDNGLPGLRLDSVGGDVSITRTSAVENVNAGILLGAVGGDIEVEQLDASTNTFGAGLDLSGPIDGVVSVTGSDFSGNGGPGVNIEGVGADVTITGVVADSNGSDGVFVDGVGTAGAFAVTNSSFTGNGLSGLDVFDLDGSVTVSDTTSSTHSLSGVSIGPDVTGTVDIVRVTATGNGDGLRFDEVVDTVTVADSLVSDSTANGITLQDNTALSRIERVTLDDNARALFGFGPDSSVVMINSTVTGNAATGADSPLFTDLDLLEIRHSTLAGNATASGTPLIETNLGTEVRLDHTVAAGNGSGGVVEPTGVDVSATFSLVPIGSNLGPTNVEADDPQLTPVADNGGATPTMLPEPDSPAVDAGDPLVAGAPTIDQRGEARILGPNIDIGAVELEAEGAISSLSPARFVDTRDDGDTFDDRFQAEGRRAADSQYRVQIAGRGDVPADARAVVVNVTAVGSSLNGFVTVHPCTDPRPVASSLNYTANVNMANELVAPLTASGELCLYSNRAIHILVDVVGYVDARSPLVPLTPARYLETRPGRETFDRENEGGGIPGAESTTTLPVAGRGAVPPDAAAVIVNVTAVGATQRGFVTVHPCLPTKPLASSLNHFAQVNRANELIASVDASGNICLFTSRAIHLVVDVVGYLPAGSTYTAMSPARFLDTRDIGETVDGIAQREGKVEAGEQYELQLSGRPGVPDTATAVVVNVTAAAPETRGFVTVHPCVDPRPNASSLNYVNAVNGANELITQLDSNGRICLYTNRRVHLVVDVVGYLD